MAAAAAAVALRKALLSTSTAPRRVLGTTMSATLALLVLSEVLLLRSNTLWILKSSACAPPATTLLQPRFSATPCPCAAGAGSAGAPGWGDAAAGRGRRQRHRHPGAHPRKPQGQRRWRQRGDGVCRGGALCAHRPRQHAECRGRSAQVGGMREGWPPYVSRAWLGCSCCQQLAPGLRSHDARTLATFLLPAAAAGRMMQQACQA